MVSPQDMLPHEIGLVFVPPASQTDPRVPLAQDFTLSDDISIQFIRGARQKQGWVSPPTLTITSPLTLNITGGLVTPIYPGTLNLSTSINIFPLASAASLVKQDETISLVAFSAEVGVSQDPVLGQQTFQYKDANAQISTITKENSRRRRVFWVLVSSTAPLTPSGFTSLLTLLPSGSRSLSVSSNSATGITSGTSQIYARDSNLLLGASYTVDPNSVEITPVCLIRRQQNYIDRGYTWGLNGEAPLTSDFSIIRVGNPPGASLGAQIEERLQQIFRGLPGSGTAYLRTVQNLTSGAVSNNAGNAGESAGSPNGSVCLGNDQRVTYTNQPVVQKLAVQVITAANNGSGSALIQMPLNTNMPSGTRFSEDRADHLIYAADGTEQSNLGTFSNLGGTGALSWVAAANSSIKPGNTVYAVPGIHFPPGSGFSVPFVSVEKAWINASSLSPDNILRGESQDLAAYADPVNSENYFVVTGGERAALHYIYKKITVTTSSSGVAVIPNSEVGCFAFVNGITGRINAPVLSGLSPSTPYKALIYNPPRSLENWQFLMKYADYQGTGSLEPTFLDGAKVITSPTFWVHTQGGGGSVFQGNAATRFVPIAMHLPSINTVDPSRPPTYSFDAPIQLIGESYGGPDTCRHLPAVPGSGLSLPAPGQVLSIATSNQVNSRSLSIRLMADGETMGFKTPVLSSGLPFQAVLSFAVQKGSEIRLVIATYNSIGGENVPIDSSVNTAVDTFRL